ncbi:arsenate reductase (glutaredoxin) [Corynebacterium guangdongense]|uniref:arsenate reductase (glutathione/glutaredoxin) n=1 Tax=Corynebacterium guangdongense TaxID=1783348 RepID=A0ABU1ZVS6_9CORY|nr:arsenate reductase (glutaredoxin) [Corynebacterium guangdongense]MDR7329010.1 arsenate reductase [Corynebacterium guangdongense]WJZ17580.1 Arsenate reductase [Corynebacterium guangdongense]
MSTIYHNPQCSTSRKALAAMRERGDEPTIIRYLDTPPTKDELRTLIARAGLSAHGAIRTKETQYKELGLTPETPDEELLDAMVAHPRLIERPIVVTDKGVRIPRPIELLDEIY